MVPRHAEGCMRRAIDLSRIGSEAGDGGPFGAVIVRAGTIVAEGWNRVLVSHDPTAHAEIEAIRAAGQVLGTHDLHGCEIFASCEPCPMCLAAILWARLERITFANSAADAAAIGFDDAVFHAQLCLPASMRAVPSVRMLAEEAKVVFANFAARPGHTLY